MKKIVIFNVGGALSSYAEFGNKKVIIDLGSGAGFSPVNDFLIPLSQRNKFNIQSNGDFKDKYIIDQVFLSHLDKDHISDYKNFREKFFANFLTCPNDNSQQLELFKVKRDILGTASESRDFVLNDMFLRTTKSNFYPIMSHENPLISIIDEISLFYINPSICEKEENLRNGYANNISLVLFLRVGTKTVFFPGDILKEGMRFIIDNNPKLNQVLKSEGVDYLIAPHHGLQTSFSEYFFQTINGNKTRLNIISEKVRTNDSLENRSGIDDRYFHREYSTGENNLNHYGVRTSGGHIVIDFETPDNEIRQYNDISAVINEFCI